MANVEILEFQKKYPSINLDKMKNDSKGYDLAIMVAYVSEIENGFIVKKQFKTTKEGTKFTYKPCENEEEAKEYSLKFKELLSKYEEKYK